MSAESAPEHDGAAFRLEIDADARFVSTARLFAASIARQYECEEERIQDLKVAVSEACSNAIKAHAAAAVAEPIRILVREEDGGLVYEVVDTGEGFEFQPADPSHKPFTDPAELLEGGVGLTLIQALFPDVQVSSGPNEGTTVRFSVGVGAGGSA